MVYSISNLINEIINMKIDLKNSKLNEPIHFEYFPVTQQEIEKLKSGMSRVTVKREKNILPFNAYYLANRPGSAPRLFTRKVVLQRLKQAAKQLEPHYGLLIFDTFRTIETQTDLFNSICNEVKSQHPKWTQEQIGKEAKRFAAHPYDSARPAPPTHNTGGATDLTIYDLLSGKQYDFGTHFDEVADATRTDFFEQPYEASYGYTTQEWETFQHNRRILFNLMKNVGFTNYREEWWHYDLGDWNWALELKTHWIFDSMEKRSVKNI
ncbi:MAG: hypothetical protein A3I12_06985 [Gammaproteobacteria bacterium RIFCSPLOWO2_02_FULL_38_11]|nr:MAG: hypothetical protein A3B69_01910 [Gammaproteobacteria bacterium RIFCSPHIGHO2_02_FULL_38_33]OGT67883.1 MAG: hypothetical protein A3I12_06985 [Gammaproteobacteria bacterium RIFCSPLOWO2_02_FULL_38_11]OGT77574.1 MAG: hypothetical protein A3G71_05735 [Gammaproteobacteria bacterium RIFCSPLOWO2_12_FULL_38_14]